MGISNNNSTTVTRFTLLQQLFQLPQQLPTKTKSIKMQFFAIAATFFAAVMAAPSAKPLMDPTTTTVGQAAEQCGVNQKLSCCNGDDASSCSPVGSANLLQLLPISQACHADASPKCCETDNQTGLINLNLQCNDILSDIGLLGASK